MLARRSVHDDPVDAVQQFARGVHSLIQDVRTYLELSLRVVTRPADHP